MHIGIIVPSNGLAEKLDRCIASIFASETRHELFLCVIDNGTRDDSVFDVCRKHALWNVVIVYVHLPWNSHFARASNTGIHVVGQMDAFLFLNNDCYINPDCIENMVKAMMRGSGDIIGAKLLYPGGAVQHAGGKIHGNWEAVTHEFRGLEADAPEVCESRNVPWVTAACMLVRAKPFVRLGGFMEVFENGYEDVDLCLRFKEKGMKVYYCADAIGIHEEAQTPGRKDHEAANAERFFNCWSRKDVKRFK